jgi:uncharacterized membrane protein (UPF0182 family)
VPEFRAVPSIDESLPESTTVVSTGRLALLFVLLIALLFSFANSLALYVDWLWFGEIGYQSVFVTLLTSQVLVGAGFGAIFLLVFFTNLILAGRHEPTRYWGTVESLLLLRFAQPLRSRLFPIIGGISLVFAFFAALGGAAHWEDYLLFRNAGPFGQQDPLFAQDLSFYVFRLPFLSYIQGWLIGLGLLTTVAVTGIYLITQGIVIGRRTVHMESFARRHLGILLTVLAALKAWGYQIDAYELLYSRRGVVFGAVYADVHAALPILKGLVALAGITAIFFLLFAIRGMWRPAVYSTALTFVVATAGLGLYPEFVHRFQVMPNESALERPYIEQNIKFTRAAYGLADIQEELFPAEQNLTAADIGRNHLTIKNIRLWDHRPLLATYKQLQQIRTYYDFVDVDNDRYVINTELRQIMLSPREIAYRNLPSRIWINEHLTYTHGYGVTMGPVNRISAEGLPEFFIRDIPPVSTIEVKVTRPEIYFGEIPNDYVFVRTKAQEFDYPSGEKNVMASYTGRGGVSGLSFPRKLLFAAYFGSLKIILSNDIIYDSRILFNRQIRQRVAKVAPFLHLDQDAYMVITPEGRLIWIVDGYTTTDRYPYAQPFGRRGNYIRNSVKATVDAYDGSVNLYVNDPNDPMVLAYQRIFPDLLKPLGAMPKDLQAHLRYPQDLFNLQSHVFATYHMQEPQIFYNKEDLWSIPKKGEKDMEPYYTIMRLPKTGGEKKAHEEFILLIPFTPAKRDNMAAWLAARSDPPNYGKLIVYLFPKQKLIYGPRQVEARIDQDSAISQQITLWSQRGSQVIRGSLLAIPIEDALLYVQPLYLSASEGALPELRRVIVAYGNQLSMGQNLEAALEGIFGKEASASIRDTAVAIPVTPPAGVSKSPRLPSPSVQAKEALDHFEKAQAALREQDWARYGEELKKMRGVLEELAKQ